MTELVKNRIAAVLLVPYLAYIEVKYVGTIGILLAPIVVTMIWTACKTFPSLTNSNVYREARFVILLLTIWNLISGKNFYGSLVAFIGLIAGIYACQASKLLWTAKVSKGA